MASALPLKAERGGLFVRGGVDGVAVVCADDHARAGDGEFDLVVSGRDDDAVGIQDVGGDEDQVEAVGGNALSVCSEGNLGGIVGGSYFCFCNDIAVYRAFRAESAGFEVEGPLQAERTIFEGLASL